MFFYLSFLRPLPRSADTANHVSITPQIANDLRTSHLEDAVDIFYAWSPSPDGASPSLGVSSAAAARKLTTWRTSSMYKNLSIPLPPGAEAGQEWRLSLSCANPNSSFVINLGAKDFGAQPFPVISMPVRLHIRGAKTKPSGKQEQVERLYSVPPFLDSGKQSTILCIREQTSFELDKKIWDSGLGLSAWMTNLMVSIESSSNPLIQQLKVFLNSSESDSLQIVELGTGTGIVSICLSTLLESIQGSRHGRIIATDLPSAIELIDYNISTNKSAYPSIDLQSLVLDWDDETLPLLGKLDLIVMADVTYNTASFPSLVRTLVRLIQSSNSDSSSDRAPCILLAYKQRDPAERTLWSMLKDIGIDVVLVDEVGGAGAEAVEIWIWSGMNDGSDRAT